MRTLLVMLLLAATSVAGGEATYTVRGTVVFDSAPVPGCTVTLRRGEVKRSVVADAEGRYAFEGVEQGSYKVEFDLTGFDQSFRWIDVTGDHAVPPQPLEPIEISFSCSLRACSDEPPETMYDEVWCRDYDLDQSLIRALEGADRSAARLLEERFARASTYGERFLIAGALLRRVPDDAAYWNALAQPAADALRFAYQNDDPPAALAEWCQQHRIEPHAHRAVLLHAFELASEDERSRPLLLRALETSDIDLLVAAISAFALRHDESVLPTIQKVFARLG
ncbi:MAG TPA: carboxypeptidase-like regulatory domain-containing protein, partial [Thermoanaerobaculia bacterium]|nr:carboxypeptidase-like regulatory domain-containing protein [Thermoanaerobaculia bacterium]